MQDDTNTPPPDGIDVALDQLRRLIEGFEAKREQAKKAAAVPPDVPKFEVY